MDSKPPPTITLWYKEIFSVLTHDVDIFTLIYIDLSWHIFVKLCIYIISNISNNVPTQKLNFKVMASHHLLPALVHGVALTSREKPDDISESEGDWGERVS